MKKLLLIFISWFYLVASLSTQTVYITNTGEKYHNGSCWTLKKSKITIDVNDAVNKGYEACKICKPAQPAGIDTGQAKTQINSPIKENTETSSVQCSATTKAGNRCKRVTTSSNGKCWQHGGN